MLVGRRTAAQQAEIQSFGVHLFMGFTMRKERAHMPWRNAPESFFFRRTELLVAAHNNQPLDLRQKGHSSLKC